MFKSKLFKIFIVIFILIFILFFLKKNIIFQEGNPIPLTIAITKFNLQDTDMVLVWKNPDQYLVKKDNFQPFIKHMKNEGWSYIEKNKNSLLFQQKNITKSVSYKSFTRFYTLIDDN